MATASVPKRPAPPTPHEAAGAWRALTLTTPDQLAPHTAAWQDLARNSAEPNAFYEPWLLLPAWRRLGPDLRVVLVLGPDGGLHGFFPFLARRPLPFLPLTVLESWRHDYGFLTTPLLRKGEATAVLETLFQWFRRSPHGAALWRLPLASADGPFRHALAEACRRHHRPSFEADAYPRALMQRAAGADEYLENALAKKRLREVRRKDRALAARGRYEHRALARGEDTTRWADDFLALEGAGWKGRDGTAIAGDPAHAAFFREMLAGAHAAGRLQFLGLYLDGRPIALKVNFLAPPGAFAFKIAFDETLHSQSPGVVLEADNVERFHADPALRWMDSCAMPGHPMIDKLWTERRLVHDLWVATGRTPGDLLVSLMPLGRCLKRCFSRPAAPPPEESHE